MNTPTKLADKISSSTVEIITLLKDEGLLKEAVISILAYGFMLYVLL